MSLARKLVAFVFVINSTVGFAQNAPTGSSTSKAQVVFHLNSEPTSLDPHIQKSSAAGYALDNLYRNLLKLTPSGELKPDLAESCQRDFDKKTKQHQITCKLKANLRWSDGTEIQAKHFLASYQRILDSKTQSRRADLFFSILNAKKYYEAGTESKAHFNSVGIKELDSRTIRFILEEKNPEFEFSLIGFNTAPLLSAQTAGKVFSGPYTLLEWKKNEFIHLKPNQFWLSNHQNLPEVKFLFIPDDSVAVKLYQRNQLHFLRRLPTHLIPQYEKSVEFHSLPIFRFDYLGFGELLKDDFHLRKALSLSLPYNEVTMLFSSKGIFGCAGLPESFFSGKPPCYSYDLTAAKEALSKSSWPRSKPLRFIFSSQGGDDHQKLATWLQIQWKKNLGLRLDIQSVESKIYFSKLKNEEQFLFRRGVSPDRLSCGAALEIFRQNDSENFLKHFEFNFEVDLIKLADLNGAESKKLCTTLVNRLMDQYAFIPTGAFEFSILAKPQLKGWTFNRLNHLDLSTLEMN
ncbi:MAG: ABC transporter substrate-binding protein [Pseudobdellovibrionaceae bacterium]